MYYKLTRSSWQGFGLNPNEGQSKSHELFVPPLQWGENVAHHAQGQGSKFYSKNYIYVYDNPLLAVLLNPIHANFPWPLLWEADAVDVQSDRGLKFGAKEVTTLHQIASPEVSTEQTVRFGILCALAVSQKAQFQSWAEAWLSKTYKAHEVTEWAEWDEAIQSEKAAVAAELAATGFDVPLVDVVLKEHKDRRFFRSKGEKARLAARRSARRRRRSGVPR